MSQEGGKPVSQRRLGLGGDFFFAGFGSDRRRHLFA